MQEYTRRMGDAIEVTKTAYKGENIIFAGEDMKKGSKVLEKGKRLSPFDLGMLSALGVSKVPVYKTPVVGLISSGDEIVTIDQTPALGKIRDINRYTISNMLKKEDSIVKFIGIVKDNIGDITEKLVSARECNMILVSGGSSKGERDFITASIDKLGGEIIFHGVNIKPGKPVIFAKLWGKPVFGLPGHPTSCIMVMVRFVLPLVRNLKGEYGHEEKRGSGMLTTNIPSTYGIEEYVRVTVEYTDGRYYITPIFAKSSVISSLSDAAGYVVIPEGREGYEKAEEVEVHWF
jgi:molybdopterin molybdotransferase